MKITDWTVGQACVIVLGNAAQSATVVKVGRKIIHAKGTHYDYKFTNDGWEHGGTYGPTARLYTVEGNETRQVRAAAEKSLRRLLDKWSQVDLSRDDCAALTAIAARVLP